MGAEKTAELALERGAALHGRVVRAEDGSGVAGALVAVKDNAEQPPRFLERYWGHGGNVDFAHERTDEVGRFRITGLPIPKPGEPPSHVPWRAWARAPDGSFASGAAFHLLPTDTQPEVVIRIEQHARITGRILGFGDSERVMISLGGRSIQLEVFRTGAALHVDISSPPGQVPVRSDGTFTAEGIPPGSVTVRFLDWSETVTLAPGEHRDVAIDPGQTVQRRARFTLCDKPLDLIAASVGYGAGLSTDPDGRYRLVVTPPTPLRRVVSEPIDLAGGERRTGLRFVLEAPEETTALSLRLHFRDVWSEESVIVHLIHPAVGEEYPDGDGLVTFPELSPGRYLGAVELDEAGRRGVTTPFAVTVPTERVVPIVMAAPGRLLVTVMSPRGAPLDGARVEVIHESGVDMFRETRRGNHEPLSDRQGRLLIDGLAPGVYRLRPFRDRPAVGPSATVKVEEDRIHELSLTLAGE